MTALMAADDPRHGAYAGAVAHWTETSPLCGPCQKAATRQRKIYRLRAIRGVESRIEATGTHRRIQALVALGYSLNNLDAMLGKSRSYTSAALSRTFLNAPTVAAYRDLYERLCMTRPEGHIAERNRRRAVTEGWPVPLAWDDIDDPNEHPTGWQRTEPRGGGWSTRDRHDELDDLLDRGAWLSEACRVLDVTADGLERWAERHGRRQDFVRLRDREKGAA